MPPKANTKKLISVVIPSYNEEGNVLRAYEAVRDVFENDLKGKYDFEIIYTDNCSEDNTFGELKKIAAKDKRVRVARFTRNFGFNKSLLTGYRLTKGDAAIQLDCDLQDSPKLFPKFLKLWEDGHDVVVGIREKREEAQWLQGLRKAFYRFLASISEDNLVIDGGDFRLVDRSILNALREIHDATPYVRGLVSTFAANQTGFPYQRQQRVFGQSKFPVMRLIGLATTGIVNHSTVPLRLATLLGFGLAGFTALLAVGYVIAKLLFGMAWPVGFATTVILQLLAISINAIFLGIIGEYISRIHHQLRQHPVAVIQHALNFTPTEKEKRHG